MTTPDALPDRLARTAATPHTAVDPADVRQRSRQRSMRRRAALGGGTVVAVALGVALAFPVLTGPTGPRVEDAPPVADAPDTAQLTLPDGWTEVRIGDAVFGLPEQLDIEQLRPDDAPPCTNGDRRGTAHLAAEGYPRSAGACDAVGPSVTSLVAAPASTVPDTAIDPADGGTWQPVTIGDLEGEVRPSASAMDWTYRFPEVDLWLRFTHLDADPQLESDVLRTLARATGSAPDDGA